MKLHCLKLNAKSVSLKRKKPLVRVKPPVRINLSSFPKRYEDYFVGTFYSLTHCVECMGAKVADKKITMSSTRIYEFVNLVCQWGAPRYVFINLERHNGGKEKTKKIVKKAVIAAVSHLHEPKPDIESALDALRTVKGLKKISFSSKILRMLMPEKAVVLDSVLEKVLKEALDEKKLTSSHYAKWCEDCVRMAKKIPKKNYMRQDKVWKAADVESVIYHEVSGKRKALGIRIP